ncbi:ArsI/CadI family heavy metal resistance metalloenzyme [Variovorax sp. PCZ-1]|uniref:ArsI/CadI family heavy metal resistance metalloenzyme n=1 Tax=Variovorax sp. PCZ-1 TaxID=2835533 RepID=UPI001BCFFF9D|nr:ArsI/CadI family heavy metal resistance metalloenzyme [Variovorax sp. PCZ-1]MBS7806695.1 VOC family protein [Variovorax sp. PCZ-1]
MKRFHIHIAVESIEQSTQFYNSLFGQQPTVAKPDYAKWMLEDPRINFAISARPAHAGQTGLDHLGFQMDSAPELHAMTSQLQAAGLAFMNEGETTCCYAKSDKGWVHDPQGIAWESFVTMGEATTYGTETAASMASESSACCAPSSLKPKISLKDIAFTSAPAVASCGSASASGASTSSCC